METEAESGIHAELPPRESPEVSDEERKRIIELHQVGYGTRKIATRVGRNRKTVQRVLKDLGLTKAPPSKQASTPASKLDPFRQLIAEKAAKEITTTRILREIGEAGYAGGRTILGEYVRSIRTPLAPRKKVKRRFETPPGKESQVDWSPYRIPIGGHKRLVHAFGAILGHCRKSHIRFYPAERQSILFEAHEHAFEDFGGVTTRIVYDRMATVVLGQIRRHQPLWHPRFLDFARHYGFDPFLCRVRDPDRKGKEERFFDYLERDFVRGSEFDSLHHLNQSVRHWLDKVANVRNHGTTGKVPDEEWLYERGFLIRLPDERFLSCDETYQQIGVDSVIWVAGTPYTVPAFLVEQKTVCIRRYAEHFEVLDRQRRVVFSRRYVEPDEKGRLQLEPEHYEAVAPRAPGSTRRLEDAFLERFPTLAELLVGLKQRMKSFAHVHLRTLRRLAARYGEEAFLRAATRAQVYRRFDAAAIRRILERDHPLVTEEPLVTVHQSARAAFVLGDVDPGSLDDYAHLDNMETSDGPEEHYDA